MVLLYLLLQGNTFHVDQKMQFIRMCSSMLLLCMYVVHLRSSHNCIRKAPFLVLLFEKVHKSKLTVG